MIDGEREVDGKADAVDIVEAEREAPAGDPNKR